MHKLIRRMTTPISSETSDAAMGSKLLYALSLAFLVLGGAVIVRADLTAPQLVLGLVLVLGVALQMVVAGLLVEVRGRLAASVAPAKTQR